MVSPRICGWVLAAGVHFQRSLHRHRGAEGCGRRVSLKRRSRISSSASRYRTVDFTILRIDLNVDGRRSSPWPSRMSRTSAARLISGESADEFRELRHQVHRKIVDAVVPEVLEGLQHRSLAGTAHAGDDDQFRTRADFEGCRRAWRFPCAGLRFGMGLRCHLGGMVAELGRAVECQAGRRRPSGIGYAIHGNSDGRGRPSVHSIFWASPVITSLRPTFPARTGRGSRGRRTSNRCLTC